MMARMLSQLPLPLLPPGAAEIAPGVGFLAGEEGGLVTVHGLATFAWDAGDEAARRLGGGAAGPAACRVAGPGGGGVRGGSGHRSGGGTRRCAGRVAGLVPARRLAEGASKLTPQLAARIAELDAAGRGAAPDRGRDRGVHVQRPQPRSGGWRPRGAACGGRHPPPMMTRAGAGMLPGRLTRWPATAGGRWPGWGCWARAPAGVHPGAPVSAGRAAAGAARAGRTPACWRWPGPSTAGSGTGFTGWR